MNNPIYDWLLALRTPTITPEFAQLHRRIGEAKKAGTLTDAILNECTDPECVACGVIVCPYNEAFHFHHDGCPACSTGRFHDGQ